MVGYYDYAELREKALSDGATNEDRINLLEWLEKFDFSSWNGEWWNIDGGFRLYEIYTEPDEDGNCELIDCEIR